MLNDNEKDIKKVDNKIDKVKEKKYEIEKNIENINKQYKNLENINESFIETSKSIDKCINILMVSLKGKQLSMYFDSILEQNKQTLNQINQKINESKDLFKKSLDELNFAKEELTQEENNQKDKKDKDE